MSNSLKTAFDSLVKNPEFQELVRGYRHKFGIPTDGFTDKTSNQYKNWAREGLGKSDFLRDQFSFVTK